MKKLILAIAILLIACGDAAKVKVVKVDSSVCAMACMGSRWDGKILQEREDFCNRVHSKAPCCAYQFTNSGRQFEDVWREGEIGRIVSCPPELLKK